MPLFPSKDEAFELAFRRDSWLWIKIPIGAYLCWYFFLPQTWKLVLLVVVGWGVCQFYAPCPIKVSDTHLYVVIMIYGIVLWAVYGYVIYAFAFLSSPGWRNKLLFCGICFLFPVAILMSAHLFVLLDTFLRIPWDDIRRFTDAWTPIPAWRVSP